jgi:hypothetical protein
LKYDSNKDTSMVFEVHCRIVRVHRPIKVAPLAFDPDVGQSPLGQLSLAGRSRGEQFRR